MKKRLTMDASGQFSLSDKTIDDLIQKYLTDSVNEIKKSKFIKQDDFNKIILNFYKIKIRFYDFVAKEYDVDYDYFLILLKQIEIITFWGIGLNDSVEKHIKNNQLFWGLFSVYIKKNDFPSFNLRQISESVNRYGRLNTSDLDKAYGVMYVESCDYAIKRHLHMVLYFDAKYAQVFLNKRLDEMYMYHESFLEKFAKSIVELSKIIDAQGNVLVYRGFDFAPGEDVRKDLKKIGNENAHIQETGLGVSFTGDKKVARQFALNKWEAMNNEVSTTWDNRVKFNKYILKKSDVDIDSFLSDKVRNAAIGTYKANKKDILLNLIVDFYLESELVILPEKLSLIDYRIIKTTKLK